MRIICNENSKDGTGKTRMESCILHETNNSNVDIAVAFFTNTQNSLLQKMVEHGCYVRMIIRLNYGTSPDALLKIINQKNVELRFYTSKHFHPKMYLIGDRKAYIGSSNFTDSGMLRNQEVNVEIDSDDYDFDELHGIFERYWTQARVLDKDTVLKFRDIISKNPQGAVDASRFLRPEIGENEYENVTTYKIKKDDWLYYSEEFKRVYQEFLDAFSVLQKIYREHGKRRFGNDFPLRIEIDRFLWWVREYKAKGDSYLGIPRTTDQEKLKEKLSPLIDEFVAADVNYLKTRAESDFYMVRDTFSSRERIESLGYDELHDALCHVHAYHDTVRYFSGGQKTQREAFMSDNALESVKKLIIHLIYDDKDYIRRIYDCCRNPEYKLQHFGDACCTELYGILNNDDIPIRNGRIEKSLEWLGFGRV